MTAREPTEAQIWAAFDAAKREAKRWETIGHTAGHGVVITAVRHSASIPPTPFENVLPTDEAYERHDFKSMKEATGYISWRSMKAAITTYEKIRS